jgi:hypothetical protein
MPPTVQGMVKLEDLAPLKKAYQKAVNEGESQFNFKGMVFLTDYAKYLIEYLESLKGGR